MSLAANGQQIVCDGDGCMARARLPVALRRLLAQTDDLGPQTAEGWLFVASRSCGRHFCPYCAEKYLHALVETNPILESLSSSAGSLVRSKRAGGC